MNLGNQVTERLNAIEAFNEQAPFYYLPIKLLGWIILIIALIFTNLVAIVIWPFSALKRQNATLEHIAGTTINVTSLDELNIITKQQPLVLIDFWAQWCGPCLLMNKTLASFAKEYADKVTVVKIDASLDTTISKHFNVRGLPTIILFKNNTEINRKAGALTKKQLIDLAINN